MNWFKTDFVYDLEVFPNIFTACFVYANGKGLRVFEISDRKNETEQLLDFLRKVKSGGYRLVAFNNINFDYPIIHYMLEKARKAFKESKSVSYTAKELYKVGMDLILTQKDDRFGKSIKAQDVIIPQVDLYLVNHYDNRSKSTSLKTLEFNMRSRNIEDLPFPVGSTLNDEQKDILIHYNKHDVLETLKFYHYCYDALKLREELTEQFGFDCTNFNDTKIGKQLFINTLEKEKPGICYTVTERGRKMKQTKRDSVIVSECLVPYLNFNRSEFKALHEWFRKQVITETKGAFSDIEEHALGELSNYAKLTVKRKKFKGKPSDFEFTQFKTEHPLGWVEEEELKSTEWLIDDEGNYVMEYPLKEDGSPDTSKKMKKKRVAKKSYWGCWKVAESLNVVIDGFQLDFGTGGLHGAKQGTWYSTEHKCLFSYDIASFYPNLAIANKLHPKHLGSTFCNVYSQLYQMRKEQPKGSAANAALKLALNGTYGETNNEYSPLYDPQYTMSITISGQLTLCMLIDMLQECNIELLMANTDGFEFFVDRTMKNRVESIVSEWEKITGLVMEGLFYKTMFIRDVNSYIAVKE